MDWKIIVLTAGFLMALALSSGWRPEHLLQAELPALAPRPAVAVALEGEAAELALQDLMLPLVRARQFDAAWSLAVHRSAARGLDPATEFCGALERAGVRMEGAVWLQSWFVDHAGDPGFADQAFAAGVFVSEYLGPRRAVRLLRPVVERHPEEYGPSAALALALLQDAAFPVDAVPEDLDLQEPLALLDRAGRAARTDIERMLVHLVKADTLAMQGRYEDARLAHAEEPQGLRVAAGDRPVYLLESAVLALRTGRHEEAADRFQQALQAWADLEPGHTERTVPVPDLALAARSILEGDPLDSQRLEEAHEQLRRTGMESQAALEPVQRFPKLVQEVHTADPARLPDLLAELHGLERAIQDNSVHMRCLSYSVHVRPLALALTHGLMAEAYERMGQPEQAERCCRRALAVFPDAPQLKARLHRVTSRTEGRQAG